MDTTTRVKMHPVAFHDDGLSVRRVRYTRTRTRDLVLCDHRQYRLAALPMQCTSDDDEGTHEMDDDEGRLGAIALPSFSPPTPVPPTPDDMEDKQVAVEWQRLSRLASAFEIRAVLAGYRFDGEMTEMIGRASSVGEQFSLALTATRDARSWATEPQSNDLRRTAVVALCEMATQWIMSASHGIAGVTFRLLQVSPDAAKALHSRKSAPKPAIAFSDSRQAWPSLNAGTAEHLRVAAEAVGAPAVNQLVAAVGDLTRDQYWRELSSRRDMHYHRSRPQTVDLGVPNRSPWRETPSGRALPVSRISDFVPPDADVILQHTLAARRRTGLTMSRWLEALPDASAELGLNVFRRDSSPDSRL